MNTITEVYKEDFINAVIEANKELYNYIQNKLSQNDISYSNSIGYGGDNSLNIDLYAEEIFIKHLSPFCNIYSEECGYKDFNKKFIAVIDPIDGSDNFASRLAYYGSSVALQEDNKTIAGFVCNLANGTLIYKAFDSNVKNIDFFTNKELLFNENSKFAVFERAYQYPKICEFLLKENIKFRSLGAAALSLADARKYEFVLFVGKLREFDIAAALYICSDLFIYKSDELLIISKNIQKTHLIKENIKNNWL
jgi:myo-inositol-1(or 4)-monophosphatase